MDGFISLRLLAYSFGIFAFVSIFRFWSGNPHGECLDRPGRRRTTPVGQVLAAVCVLWFADLLLLTLQPHVTGLPKMPLQIVQLIVTLAFPPLIMHITLADEGRYRDVLAGRAWRWPVTGMWIVSQGLSLWLLAMIFGLLPRVDGVLNALGYVIGALFSIAAVYGGLATWRASSGHRSPRRNRLARWMIGLYVATALLVMIPTLVGWASFDFSDGFQFLVSLLPMLFFFTALYHEDRFRFLDLLVKRGAFLLVSIATLVAWFLWAQPRFASVTDPRLGAWAAALAILPLVLLLRWVYERLQPWLDSVLFGRQHGPAEAIKRFLADLGRATDEPDLIERCRRGMSEIFGAPVEVRLGVVTAARNDFEPEVEQPIRTGGDGKVLGRVLLGRRVNDRPYFSGDLTLIASLSELFATLLEHVRLQEGRREQERIHRELELRAGRSELQALRAQINPHFLFNALNAIAGLIHKDPLRADRTIEQLAEIFRYTLRGARREWSSLRDEFDFVEAYLDVERARFGDRLTVRTDLAPDVERLRVPALMLQTLVENAIKHGVARVPGRAEVQVGAARQGGRLVIEVRDSGPGFGAGRQDGERAASGEGFGLQNVRERLAGHFGDDASLSVARDGDPPRTRVRLALPVDHPDVAVGESGVA